MEIRDLNYLVAAVTAGNFAHAANALGMNTSTISRRIARLEDELGLTIFERGHAGIRLTAGGKAVTVHARRALAELDALKQAGSRAGSGEVGEIRLGVRFPPVGETFCHLLASWRRQYPSVALVVSELNERDISAALEERRLDVALIAGKTLQGRAASFPICQERLVVAVPLDHRLAACRAVSWRFLTDEIILLQGWEECQTAREFSSSILCSRDVTFRTYAAGHHTILALVAAGFGIALTAKNLSEAPIPGVVFKEIDEPNAWLEHYLVWMPEVEDPVIGRFVAFMRDAAHSRRLV